jgi:hypothetical protein
MGDIALPSSDKLRALAQSLGTTPDDLLQAAGYIDNPLESSDLPEIKVYLRRKYSMQDARALQAIETIINCLYSASSAGTRNGSGGSADVGSERIYAGGRSVRASQSAQPASSGTDRSTGQRGRKPRAK